MGQWTRIAVIVTAAIIVGANPELPVGEKQGDKAPPKKTDTKHDIMKKKLAQAQKLLEGLALQDFAKIEAAADELAMLRKEAAWMMIKSKEYEVLSWDFSRQIEATKKAAKAKNVDAAALAYVDMTLTCVKCHKHVREEGIAMQPMTGFRGATE